MKRRKKDRDRRERDLDRGPAPSVASMRAGPGPTIKERSTGATWRLGWNDQDAKAALEMQIVSHVTLAAVERAEVMGEVGGAKFYGRFQGRVDSGEYHTFAPGWRSVMGGLDASWLFLLSLLLEHQPGATAEDAKRLLADEPLQVRAAVEVVAPDFFAVVTVQMKDRDVPADEAAAAGRELAAVILENVFGIVPTKDAETTPPPTAEPATG